MGGNVKEAHLAHLTVEIDGEAKQIWVKAGESDEAVSAFAREFLLKNWVQELSPESRFKELRDALEERFWVEELRSQMPDVQRTERFK